MARRKKSLKILTPEGRLFACRDCPARCCTSWGIPVTPKERERIFGDDEACARLDARGEAILRGGTLPMREENGTLACGFLDDDLLCSLQKRHGHSFLPAACQSFPFGFSKNEEGQPVALLSRYCPSIRDNYGDPVTDVVQDKYAQVGGARPMSERMGFKSGRALPKHQYVAVVKHWESILQEGGSPAESLSKVYDFTDAFDEALPPKVPEKEEIKAAIKKGAAKSSQPLSSRKRLSFDARVLLALLLGSLSYPSRVLVAHRVTPVSFWERLRSWGNKLAWLFSFGTVALLFVKRPVKVRRVGKVKPFLAGEFGALVRDYLLELLMRRYGMTKKTYLNRVIVDMAMMTVVASRYARAAASAEGRNTVEPADVKEGIGIAELLFAHQGEGTQSVALNQMRQKLMASPKKFRALLASEA